MNALQLLVASLLQTVTLSIKTYNFTAGYSISTQPHGPRDLTVTVPVRALLAGAGADSVPHATCSGAAGRRPVLSWKLLTFYGLTGLADRCTQGAGLLWTSL